MVLIGISPPAYPTLPQSCECMIPSSFMLSYLFPGEEIIRHYSDTTNFSCLFEVSTKRLITVHHNPTLLEKETEKQIQQSQSINYSIRSLCFKQTAELWHHQSAILWEYSSMDRGVELEWCWGGVGWCYVFVISVWFLVQFDMVLDGVGPSWCVGILWGMDALVPDPSPKKTIGKSGWFSTLYWSYGSRSWTSCFDFAGVFFFTWTDLLLSCFYLVIVWFALPWISWDILWCRLLPQGDLIRNTIKVQEETTPQDINIKVFQFPRDENQHFCPTSSEHFAPGSASVAWGGGISLPRWNQGMVPWPFGVHGYAEGSKVILLFK